MTFINPFQIPTLNEMAIVEGLSGQFLEFTIGDNFYIVVNSELRDCPSKTTSPEIYDFIGWLLKNN